MNNDDKASLRLLSIQLAEHQAELDQLNGRRSEINQSKSQIETSIKQIITKAEYAQINQLALSNGQSIRIIRQYSKGWSLSKSRFRDLVHEFWNSPTEKNPENLISYVYNSVHADSQTHDIKLELR
jgi:hypothetical protein